MATAKHSIATVDNRRFFERALSFGVSEGIISENRLETILEDGPKGIVQIANFFGTAHLRTDLDNARERMVNLISLYLENISGGDLQQAAFIIRDKSFLSLSKGGSDLLKMLHAMPDTTLIGHQAALPEDQKNFLNDKTFASPMANKPYVAEQALRTTCQQQVSLACWLARKMGLPQDSLQSVVAETVVRSALLVLFIKDAKLEFPGRTGLIKLIESARKKTCELDELRLNRFLAKEPDDFAASLCKAMDQFTGEIIPQLRNHKASADALLHGGEEIGDFFINENVTEDLGEYDKLVAKEWHRVTKGDGDDPSVIATLFLFIATGFPPKASALLREAKEVIASFREKGFDTQKVISYIETNAPHQMQEDLIDLWKTDLKPEAEIHLADLDPQMPDSHMDRALRYYQATCNTSWKGRSRR